MQKYAAELAADGMEKSGIAVSTIILLSLMAAPFVTRGINWASGHDPSKGIKGTAVNTLKQYQKRLAETGKLGQPPAPTPVTPATAAAPAAPTVPAVPATGATLKTAALGLHAYRAGA